MGLRVGPLGDDQAWSIHGFSGDIESLTAAGTLPRAWVANWLARPAAPVLFSVGTSDTSVERTTGDALPGPWLTGADLLAQTASVAQRFHQLGATVGDRILMSAPPSVGLVIAHVAALRMGAIVVPVNTAYTTTEVEAIAAQARPTLAVLDDPLRLPDISSINPDDLLLQAGNREGGSREGGGREGGSQDREARAETSALDAAATGDPALLMFTSGTTGKPKGVVLTHGNILASAEALRIAWRWVPEDRLVLSLPLFHMHGLGVGVHGTLLAGASCVIVSKFDVDAVFDAIREHSATLLFGVPTMWVRIGESPRVKELAVLRLCVSGSAPLSPDVFHALKANGGQTIVERYGMTETVMNVSNPYDGLRRAGSVGVALPGVQVRLAGDESMSPDEPGEILLKGPNVMHTYWENSAATTAAFDADGWFLTGDIGQFDANGYLSIVGRSKDLIITGGFNVYPREVEEALLLHPAVVECAVVGIPDAQWGESVVAYVVASEPVSEHSIFDHASTHLARFKQPRQVRFIDTLPRNALGKVVKSELR